jgi:aspartate aminotransferase
MIRISDRINALSESETLAMTRKSRELQAQGKDVINLSIGEPDFDTPEFIKQSAIKAIEDNYSHYTPVPGFMDLREAICHKFKRDNKIDYTPEQIVVSTGAKHSLANVLLTMVNPGDEVILPSPFWVSYKEMIKMAQGIEVRIHAGIEQDFKINAEQLENAITPKSRLLMFNSPSNPTGSVYTYEEVEALAKVIEKHENLYVVSDEIYEHINFIGGHTSMAAFDSIKDRVITINGVSKGYAMTGWRIGIVAAHKEIADAITKLQGQFTSGTNAVAQRAAITAMMADPKSNKDMTHMLSKFKARRDMVVEHLKDVPGMNINTPSGAFYVFPDVSALYGKADGDRVIENNSDLCMYILETENVALVPGSAFGCTQCIRISYATSSSTLIEAIKRIKRAVARLK